MLKSIAFILVLSGALLATSMVVNAQLSHKDNVSVNDSSSTYSFVNNILCRRAHICK